MNYVHNSLHVLHMDMPVVMTVHKIPRTQQKRVTELDISPQGLTDPKFFTDPPSKIMRFTVCLYIEYGRNLCSNPLAQWVVLLAMGCRAMGYIDPSFFIGHFVNYLFWCRHLAPCVTRPSATMVLIMCIWLGICYMISQEQDISYDIPTTLCILLGI